ncbi:MAG TPA: putative sulfate exporter family transporter [Anaeromyxobacteraceae bacterium]|nr:putative sulfate exporter family transporter [Anaeromyxobacteraceae bacterium]
MQAPVTSARPSAPPAAAPPQPSGLSLLWKTEDWLAVWVGFLVIVLVLAGVPVKLPKFKWTTDGAFAARVAEVRDAGLLEKLESGAAEKGAKALQADLGALRAAVASADRKAVAEAAKKVEASAKAAPDAGLKGKAGKLSKDLRGEASNRVGGIFAGENLLWAVYIGIAYLVLTTMALRLMGQKAMQLAVGFPVVFALAWLAQFIAGNSTVVYYGVEYVLWCLFLGLFVSNVLGVPAWLKPAVRTEFYIKSGLVVLGAGILFGEIVQAGAYGIVQGLLVVIAVWYFTYWVARKLRVDDEFAAVLSSAVSICGVSAAIATGGAIKADGKKISYTTSIVLLCAIPMLIFQPMIAKWAGMSDIVAGAWLGGTLDTSGSVVAAGALISDTAMKTGVIVKMSQNVLIGVAAFILSVVWTMRTAGAAGRERPGAMEIWHRFPKFVLGFAAASILFSFIVDAKTVEATKGALTGLRTWWFALAFASIGLETRFGELTKMEGGRPAGAFLIGQAFNVFWTLLLAWLIFGGVLFGVPSIK